MGWKWIWKICSKKCLMQYIFFLFLLIMFRGKVWNRNTEAITVTSFLQHGGKLKGKPKWVSSLLFLKKSLSLDKGLIVKVRQTWKHWVTSCIPCNFKDLTVLGSNLSFFFLYPLWHTLLFEEPMWFHAFSLTAEANVCVCARVWQCHDFHFDQNSCLNHDNFTVITTVYCPISPSYSICTYCCFYYLIHLLITMQYCSGHQSSFLRSNFLQVSSNQNLKHLF